MSRALVMIGGIGTKAYMMDKFLPVLGDSDILRRYDYIEEIDYQPILDDHAIVMKKLLDPVRMLLTQKGERSINYVQRRVKELSEQYDHIDLVTHSQGCWIGYRCDVKVDNFVCIANPIGFKLFVGAASVRLNIGTPKLSCNRILYLYSFMDYVSCDIPHNMNKWLCSAKDVTILDTGTGHDVSEYLEWCIKNSTKIII